MPELILQNVEVWLAQLLLPLFRIGAFFLAVPIIGTRMVPARVRLLMALAVTIVVVPLVQIPAIDISFNVATVRAVVQEVLIGILFGFFLQIFFHLFIVAGQMIAMQMGLGFASMVDPSNGITVAVVSQLFVILTTLLFLAMNGHLVMIEIVVDSFTAIPPMLSIDWSNAFWQIASYGSWMFAKALLLAVAAVSGPLPKG
jgi:flagellar biosynthetic protein FliR